MRAFLYMVLCLSAAAAAAQTSNVQTVKAWTRAHVMGLPGGTLRDPTGTIADAQRQAAVTAAINESSNIVAAAGRGLTNALERLWDAADATNSFTGRLYLAADMDADPDCANIEAFVLREEYSSNTVRYFTHYTRTLETAPKTVWAFEPAPGEIYWAPGTIDTNAPMANIAGYACYEIVVERPAPAAGIVLRTNRFLRWGAPATPLDVPDAGLELACRGATNAPYTGSVTYTNGNVETTETYLSGFLHTSATNTLEAL